jgi:hypothetical protein
MALGSDRGGVRPITYAFLNARLWDEATLFGFPAEEVDRQKRALGLVQTVDYYLLKLAGIEIVGKWANGMDPAYYSPVGLPDGAKMPETPGTVQQQIYMRWVSQTLASEVASRLPEQHSIPGIDQVVRCRTLVLMASLGPDELVARELSRVMREESEPSRLRATAFMGLLAQGDEAGAGDWLRNHGDPELVQLVAESLAPSERRAHWTSDPRHFAQYGSHESTMGRSLDEDLLRRFDASADASLRQALAAALAGRTDNVQVRSKVIEMLRSGDPEIAIQVLRQRPPLVEDAEYQEVLRNLLISEDFRVRSWATENYAIVPDPTVRDRIAKGLGDEDPRVALNALRLMGVCGRYDPTGTIEMIKTAVRQRALDGEFVRKADLQLKILQAIESDPEAFRKRNEALIRESLRGP